MHRRLIARSVFLSFLLIFSRFASADDGTSRRGFLDYSLRAGCAYVVGNAVAWFSVGPTLASEDFSTLRRTVHLPVGSPLRKRFGLELMRQTVAAFFKADSRHGRDESARYEDAQIDALWNQIRARLKNFDTDAGIVPVKLRYELRTSDGILLVLHPEFLVRYDGWVEAEYDRVRVLERRVVEVSLGASPSYRMRVDVHSIDDRPGDRAAVARATARISRAVETSRRARRPS